MRNTVAVTAQSPILDLLKKENKPQSPKKVFNNFLNDDGKDGNKYRSANKSPTSFNRSPYKSNTFQPYNHQQNHSHEIKKT